uniref:Uncharacterized protein n=1 Tax=Rhizophora mucronata TaxID=61149 RepID=A0A2P2LDJ4_RHIMU
MERKLILLLFLFHHQNNCLRCNLCILNQENQKLTNV